MEKQESKKFSYKILDDDNLSENQGNDGIEAIELK